MSGPFFYSMIKSVSDTKPRYIETTWYAFVESLKTPTVRDKKDGPAVIFASFAGEQRLDKNVREISAFGIDLDDGTPREEIEAKLQGLTYVCHTTFSHSPVLAKRRVVVRLSPSAQPELLPRIFAHFQRVFSDLDPQCKNPSRLFYLPACPPGAEDLYEFFASDGMPFDPLSIPEEIAEGHSHSSIAVALTGLSEGERNDGIFRYASALRADGVNWDDALALVLQRAAECQPPLDEAEAMHCLKSAWRYPESFHNTDTGNAARLITRHGENIRHIAKFGKWILWDSKRWLFDEDAQIVLLAKDTALSIYTEAAAEKDDARRAALSRWAVQSESLHRLSAMTTLAQSELPIRPEQLDANPMLLGYANGVVDLATGILRAAKREDFVTKQVPIEFDPAATCPTWLKFLHRIMNDDGKLIDFMQRAIGYSLTKK